MTQENVKCQMSNVKLNRVVPVWFRAGLFVFVICHLSFVIFAQDSDYAARGWAARAKNDFDAVYKIADACCAALATDADKQSQSLTAFPASGSEASFKALTEVATCFFVKGEALRQEGKTDEAAKAFKTIVDKYPFAQAWDPRGWYWSLADTSRKALCDLGQADYCQATIGAIEAENKLVLVDEGTEFPVDYAKYGQFLGIGTKDYRYVAKDPMGLAQASGEGVYPNSASYKISADYTTLKKELGSLDHWKLLNSRDRRRAFYKWNSAPEAPGARQFYLAQILEESGYIKQAIKAYYAVIVFFPGTYSWTYWHTPWYPAATSLYRIKYLLKTHPEVGLSLYGTSFEVVNGNDNDIRNDQFMVDPGKLEPTRPGDDLSRQPDKIIGRLGAKKVQLVKHKNGDWQMLVNGKPFMLKGITYSPTRIGESPDNNSVQNWTTQDINGNGIVDSPFESWVDKNHNDAQDPDEPVVGDFQLMKEMGVNCIRVYHQPLGPDKKILRRLYEQYGIYSAIGDFLGKYALASGAAWNPGTDYDDPLEKARMLASVRAMVKEYKNEEFVLFWVLGNENVYGLGCNADQKPGSFFKFVNQAAKLVKSLDPLRRPVVVASGDTLYLNIFAADCPDVDIYGANVYRGRYGFLDFWDQVKKIGKPAIVTEFGAPAQGKGYSWEEAEDYQAQYHQAAWRDMMDNACGRGAGNALGGFVFAWLDEWWKAYEPAKHDTKGLFSGPFLDGYMHEEWLGIVGQGQGKNSPFERQLRKAYFAYKEMWN